MAVALSHGGRTVSAENAASARVQRLFGGLVTDLLGQPFERPRQQRTRGQN
jgi:hypothetical protein